MSVISRNELLQDIVANCSVQDSKLNRYSADCYIGEQLVATISIQLGKLYAFGLQGTQFVVHLADPDMKAKLNHFIREQIEARTQWEKLH